MYNIAALSGIITQLNFYCRQIMIGTFVKYCLGATIGVISALTISQIHTNLFAARRLGFPEELPPGCSSFEIIHGKLSGAHTIFLGENHTRKEETYSCIYALSGAEIPANPVEHTLFMEGHGSGRSCFLLSPPSLLLWNIQTCEGWDDMEAHSQLVSDIQKLNEKLEALQPNSPQIEEEVAKIAHNSYSKMKDLQHTRNKSLIKAIKNKPQGQRAIVIAGKDHLVNQSAFAVTDWADADYVRNELEQFKDTNPYAILAMKV